MTLLEQYNIKPIRDTTEDDKKLLINLATINKFEVVTEDLILAAEVALFEEDELFQKYAVYVNEKTYAMDNSIENTCKHVCYIIELIKKVDDNGIVNLKLNDLAVRVKYN